MSSVCSFLLIMVLFRPFFPLFSYSVIPLFSYSLAIPLTVRLSGDCSILQYTSIVFLK